MDWRPNFLWLPMGLILGAASGAVVGAVLMLFLAGPHPAMAFIGLFYGGFVGGVLGLFVGLLMSFAVGSHLPVQQARERAFLVGFAATGLPLSVLASGGIMFPFAGVVGFVGAVTGGLLSYWAASLGRSTGPARG